jgi:galactokinase
LLGIDTGTRRQDAALRYERVRTASFMGRALIEKIHRHEAPGVGKWNGYLSHITVAQYVEGLRDRLPTKLLGSEFLDRFGETGDPLTRVDPAHGYRIRSRTEHHIYEHARAVAFFELLARAVSDNDRAAAMEIGELMYASHWSYGQRCGLGSVEADFLVSSLRKLGTGAHIYGARTAGRGCGGVVCVFMANSEKAQHAVRLAVEAAAKKFGHEPKVIRASAPGTLVRGAQRV